MPLLDPSAMDKISESLAALLVAGGSAIAATIGGMVNAWLARRKQHTKDLAIALEKIRDLYKRLGIEIKCPSELKSLDDVFNAVRRITAQIDTKPGEKKP